MDTDFQQLGNLTQAFAFSDGSENFQFTVCKDIHRRMRGVRPLCDELPQRSSGDVVAEQQCKNNFVFFDEKAGMIKSVNGLTRSTIRCRRHPFTVANVRFAGNQSRTPISNCTIV